jgi:uncharacterized membrane-anchored protein YitT (DUF2179 family)
VIKQILLYDENQGGFSFCEITVREKTNEKEHIMKKKIFEYLLITIGVGVAVAGLNIFLVPGRIAAGGVSGIATILYHLWNVPLGLSIIVLNIPLFVFGIKFLGKNFAVRTVYALVLYSVAAELIPVPAESFDPFIACIYGGVLVGVGIGLVVRMGGTTGGTDMAAKLLSEKFRTIGLGAFLFGIDFIIIAAAGIVFDPEVALYAIASLFVTTKVIDFMTVGLSASKAFYIISEKSDEIADAILTQMDRGVTSFAGKGHYSKKDKDILLCVLKWRTEGARLKKLVKAIDKDAFVIVADVKEVLGEGF